MRPRCTLGGWFPRTARAETCNQSQALLLRGRVVSPRTKSSADDAERFVEPAVAPHFGFEFSPRGSVREILGAGARIEMARCDAAQLCAWHRRQVARLGEREGVERQLQSGACERFFGQGLCVESERTCLVVADQDRGRPVRRRSGRCAPRPGSWRRALHRARCSSQCVVRSR